MEFDWTRLREIVEEALPLGDDARAEHLRAACGGDDILRARVEELIGAAERDDGFLEPPPRTAAGPGETIGPYRIVRALGAGGMGAVYEAERTDPQRRVALKVMRHAWVDRAAVSRFRYEVEVLAHLRHPGIATLYEAGVQADVPWFAMELVEDGEPITAWVRRTAPGLRGVARLFATVCDAVHHGHVHGVVHRDLKPDNILVDREGRPRVIDFGVARAASADQAATQRTTAGEIIGTLRYMSPEQFLGDRDAVDTRSDVYALGVVLFELLTGALPHPDPQGDILRAADEIRNRPPRRPGTLRRDLRGEMETVVLKCLAKDPEERYESAAALAGDLRRWLDREPILAHPPSVAYQLKTFARRNRTLVIASVAILLVSIVAAIVSAGFALRARAEGQRVRELFGSLLDRSLDTTGRFVPQLIEIPGATELVREMTAAHLEDLASLEPGLAADPRSRDRLAWAYLQIGAVQGDPDLAVNLGDRAAALRSYERALDLARALHDAQPADPDATYLYATALRRLAGLQRYDGDTALVRTRLEAALALFDALPGRWDAALGGATTRGLLAAVHDRLGEREEAARLRQLQLAAMQALLVKRPDDARVRFEAARAYASMAGPGVAPAGRVASYSEAIELLEELQSEAPRNVPYRMLLAWCSMHAATVEDDPERKAASADRAVALYAELGAEDEDNAQIPLQLAMAHSISADVWAGAARAADPDARRECLVRARDGYRAAWELYAGLQEQGRLGGHAGFVDAMRERYEALRAAVGDG